MVLLLYLPFFNRFQKLENVTFRMVPFCRTYFSLKVHDNQEKVELYELFNAIIRTPLDERSIVARLLQIGVRIFLLIRIRFKTESAFKQDHIKIQTTL